MLLRLPSFWRISLAEVNISWTYKHVFRASRKQTHTAPYRWAHTHTHIDTGMHEALAVMLLWGILSVQKVEYSDITNIQAVSVGAKCFDRIKDPQKLHILHKRLTIFHFGMMTSESKLKKIQYSQFKNKAHQINALSVSHCVEIWCWIWLMCNSLPLSNIEHQTRFSPQQVHPKTTLSLKFQNNKVCLCSTKLMRCYGWGFL